MRHATKLRLGVAAVAIGAVTFAALPANASTGFFTLSGSGTISPGLTTVPTAQTWTFAGSGVAVTDTYVGTINCTLTGNDTIGTVAQSQGTFSGTCVTAGAEPFSGAFTRVGETETVSGYIGPGAITGTVTGRCDWEPTSAPTVTTSQQQCYFVVH